MWTDPEQPVREMALASKERGKGVRSRLLSLWNILLQDTDYRCAVVGQAWAITSSVLKGLITFHYSYFLFA